MGPSVIFLDCSEGWDCVPALAEGPVKLVRLLTGVDFQGQENLSGFLAFFLKTLRNPVQAAPVGHR